MNIIIDKNTFKVIDVNRLPQSANEFEVVGVSDIQKEIQVPVKIPKVDGKGNQLYILPQPNLIQDKIITKTIESTDDSGTPIMLTKTEKVELLDENGAQVQYETTVLGETTIPSDQPVMIQIEDEEGNITEEQKTNDNGELLYYGQVGTGQFIKCYTTKEIEFQKVDENGELLFYNEVEETIQEEITQEPLEVTDQHPEYTEDLEIILVDAEETQTILLSEAPEFFTYEEVEQSLSTLKQIKLNELYNGYQAEKNGQVTSTLLGEDGLNIVFPYGEKDQNNYRSIGITFALDETQTESIIGSDSHGKFYINREDFMTLTKEFQNFEVGMYMKFKQKEVEVNACDTVEEVLEVTW